MFIPVNMGGTCSYKFNEADYPDPYDADVITAKLAYDTTSTTDTSVVEK